MKKSILLVDENKPLVHLIENNLPKTYITRSVENAYFAMQSLMTEQPYDLFIIDIDSRSAENFMLLQHISTSGFFKTTPVMVLSNAKDQSFINTCENMGNVTFLPKPFDPVLLSHKVNNILRNAEAGQIIKKKRRLFNLNFY